MSTWNLKYQTQYTTQSDSNNAEKTHTLQFLYKDYAGSAITITGGSVTVLQKCTLDDPTSPVKGQSLDIRLINAGNLPITSFYSDADDDIQVKLLDENNNILFIGFLVQDDLSESKVDFQHEISLSANDSLGLLKGVILSDAYLKIPFDETIICTNGPLDQILISTSNTAFNPVVGQIVEVQGVEYTITAISTVPITIGGRTFNFTLTVTPSVAAPIVVSEHETIYLTGHLNLLLRNSLLSMIGSCLFSTNLPLITNIYCGILETHNDPTKSAFDQILVDSQNFINGETFDNCYTVLEKILTAFKCTLFQTNGQWNIVHWPELKMFPNGQIPGYQYDEHLILLGGITLNSNFNVGPEPQLTRPIYPLMEYSYRGYKFVRKTFNYKQPKYLLENYDFMRVGALIREYQYSSFIFKEYVAVAWESGYGTFTAERFIRVVYDLIGNEVQRYLVLKGLVFDDPRAVQSMPFEISKTDKLKVSFSFRTTETPYNTIQFAVAALQQFPFAPGPNVNYVQNTPPGNGEWLTTVGFAFSTSGTNMTWNGVSIESSGIPYDGLGYVFLAQGNLHATATTETHYSDVRLEYIPFINDSTKIIGQIHDDSQDINIKNNSNTIIHIDDAPRNSIAGCLFLTTKTGLLQTRTSRWGYLNGTENWRLGELNAIEELQWRSVTRSKLEGNFVGNIQNGNYMSLLCPCITTFNPTKVYVPGLLTMDYKRNQFYCTLWEITDSETPDVADTYLFSYIYDTK